MTSWGLPIVVGVLLCCGCSSVRSVGRDERFVRPDDPAIVYKGRWDRSDPQHPQASWPGFGLAMDFEGQSISVRMRDAGNFYNVYVDGAHRGVVGGDVSALTTYPLASNLGKGMHHLELKRRNISFDKPTVLEGFVVEKTAVTLPPAPMTLPRIEFIGDSYTAAEGNEASTPTLPWKDKYPVTNFDRGYAAEVARGLGVEMTAVCRSGAGVLCDFQGDRKAPMTERYEWALMDDPAKPWKFSAPAPNLVLISLGLNDHNGLKDAAGEVSAEHSAEFRTAYRKMISMVSQRAPRAKIVAVASYVPWVRENVRQVLTQEPGVLYVQFDEYPGGYVADGHPTVETHRKMAAQILAQLKEQGISSQALSAR